MPRPAVLVYGALLLAAAAYLWPGSPAGKAVISVTSGVSGLLEGAAL